MDKSPTRGLLQNSIHPCHRLGGVVATQLFDRGKKESKKESEGKKSSAQLTVLLPWEFKFDFLFFCLEYLLSYHEVASSAKIMTVFLS